MKNLLLYLLPLTLNAISFTKKEFTQSNQKVRYASFSSDDSLIATASYDSTVNIYDAESLEILDTYQHDNPVSYVEFLNSGQIVTFTDKDNKCFLWDINTKQIMHIFTDQDSIKKITFNNEKIIFIFDYYIKIYSLFNCDFLSKIDIIPYENIKHAFINYNNDLIVITAKFITTIDLNTFRIKQKNTYEGALIKYFYQKNSDSLVFYNENNKKIIIYNTISYTKIYLEYDSNEELQCLYIDDENSILITVNNSINIINFIENKTILIINDSNKNTYYIVLNNNSDKIISLKELNKHICYDLNNQIKNKKMPVKNAYKLY
mgnify:CR=1 FL=1